MGCAYYATPLITAAMRQEKPPKGKPMKDADHFCRIFFPREKAARERREKSVQKTSYAPHSSRLSLATFPPRGRLIFRTRGGAQR